MADDSGSNKALTPRQRDECFAYLGQLAQGLPIATSRPPPCHTSEAQTLDELIDVIGDCRRCGLSEKRNHIVFGVGNPKADIVLIGEAPGHNEDMQGIPFVGAAGQLLDKMLAAIQLDRTHVYICNVCKCRPPNNRDPSPQEASTCQPFLMRQIEIIQPRVIMTLGRWASQTLLETKRPMGKMRGQLFNWKGIWLIPTWHPAYLFHHPDGKKQSWQDLKLLRQLIDNDYQEL